MRNFPSQTNSQFRQSSAEPLSPMRSHSFDLCDEFVGEGADGFVHVELGVDECMGQSTVVTGKHMWRGRHTQVGIRRQKWLTKRSSRSLASKKKSKRCEICLP